MKNFSVVRLENPLKSFPGIRIQPDIKDQPRKVTEFHFCRSHPKKRNHPQLYALSRKALERLGINYEEAKQDSDTAQYLSGSKLIQESEVTNSLCSLSPITTAVISSATGQGN